MLSLVLPAALMAVAAPAPPASAPSPWTAEARCAAVLSGEASVKAEQASLPVEALIKMNRAAGAAKAAGVSRDVVERDVETFKVVFRRLETSKPAEFQGAVRSCRVAAAPSTLGET